MGPGALGSISLLYIYEAKNGWNRCKMGKTGIESFSTEFLWKSEKFLVLPVDLKNVSGYNIINERIAEENYKGDEGEHGNEECGYGCR